MAIPIKPIWQADSLQDQRLADRSREYVRQSLELLERHAVSDTFLGRQKQQLTPKEE